MSAVIAAVDLRTMFGAMRDQRQRPTCMVFAASDAHAGLRDGWTPLSCEYLFYRAITRAKRRPHQAAPLGETLIALRKDGQPPEEAWPYLPVTPPDPSTWLPPSPIGALFGRDGAAGTEEIAQVIAHVEAGTPVILLILLSDSFYRPDGSAVVSQANDELPDPNRRHAVIAVGTGQVAGEKVVLIRNSWGPKWGEGGYGWLTEKFLGPRLYATAILKGDVDVSANSAAA